MRLAVAATPDVAIPTLNWLLSSRHEIALVITQPDKPSGRGLTVSETAVATWSNGHGIELFKSESTQQLADQLANIDLVITIGYGVLLPEAILSVPKHGFLNLHFSLLPAYRGAAPAQRALENGEQKTGVTVFALDKGMDTGPIYTQISLDINPRWRSKELLHALSIIGADAVSQALVMIEKGSIPQIQIGDFSLAPKIEKAQARLDFALPAPTLVNKVRAFTPDPGSWTMWKGESFKISQALVAVASNNLPGQISFIGGELFVQCGDGTALKIEEVTPAGKKQMSASDWARGAHLTGGEFFG